MILTVAPTALNKQVKDMRTALLQATDKPGVAGISARLALACFPQFLLAVGSEIRQDPDINDVATAAADLAGNIIATIASTAHPDDQIARETLAAGMLKVAAEVINRQFLREDTGGELQTVQ